MTLKVSVNQVAESGTSCPASLPTSEKCWMSSTVDTAVASELGDSVATPTATPRNKPTATSSRMLSSAFCVDSNPHDRQRCPSR